MSGGSAAVDFGGEDEAEADGPEEDDSHQRRPPQELLPSMLAEVSEEDDPEEDAGHEAADV